MLLKPALQARLSQQLTMTRQLRLAIRLLQLSSLELKTEIREAFESNPMLEAYEDHEADYPPPSSQRSQNEDRLGWLEKQDSAKPDSLEQHLLRQLELSSLSERDYVVATVLINALDESGYLQEPLEDIRQNLNANHTMALELNEIAAVLKFIQHFDPVGCGARCLRECLEIQLQQLPEDTPFLSAARLIVAGHLDVVGSKNYLKLMKSTGFSSTEIEGAVILIQSLYPKPGDLVNVQKPEYIIPDVYVHKHKDTWRVTLNGKNTPRLRINDVYYGLLKNSDKDSERDYVRHQLQEARWFIKSLQNRNETLLKVATSIVRHQRNFLEYGEAAMRPLVLRDVAEELDMHESTISRATTNKYMDCPRGTFEFKYFFSSHVNTHDGGVRSATAVKAIIGGLIKEENHLKPLSDNKIAMLLEQKGICVARRTIAKYRESMAIPPSHERRNRPHQTSHHAKQKEPCENHRDAPVAP